MNQTAFKSFCSDFDIFPDILSKNKTIQFFNTLAQFHSDLNTNQYIDEHLFIEALALTAFEIAY